MDFFLPTVGLSLIKINEQSEDTQGAFRKPTSIIRNTCVLLRKKFRTGSTGVW